MGSAGLDLSINRYHIFFNKYGLLELGQGSLIFKFLENDTDAEQCFKTCITNATTTATPEISTSTEIAYIEGVTARKLECEI
jgi:hypothetical protein